jgi:HSP20 family protein
MATLERRSHAQFPDLFDWLNAPWPARWPFGAGAFRVEDYTQNGSYVVRAELPGLDPDKDIDIAVDAGILTIQAERREEHKAGHRSEFHYGSLVRSITLPPGADPDHIKASYDQGILEVSVPVAKQAKPSGRHIAIGSRD